MQRWPGWFIAIALPLSGGVKVQKGGDRIDVEIDGRPFTSLFFGPETTKPYFHPLRSASGKVVTRHYPMESVPGESHDHPHHRGLWFTHGDVNGYTFWDNDPSQKSARTGRVVLRSVGELKSGERSGSLAASFTWSTPDGEPIVAESRNAVFYASADRRVMDFDFTLTALEKIKFGDTKEGTFALRLAAPLEEATEKSQANHQRTGLMTDSEGHHGEKEVWGKAADWVDYCGELEGEKLCVTIMDHPANPRHPTRWHARGYGLFAANIFGLHDFLNDKSSDGSLPLEAGKSLRFRYRVVIHSGDTQSSGVAEMYKEYASGK